MITTVLLFFPFTTCLFWLALNPLVLKKSYKLKILELFSVICGITFFAEAGLTCTNGNAMLSLFLIKQISALLIIPVMYLYIRSQSSDEEKRPSIQAFIAVPISLLVAQIIILLLTGPDFFLQNVSTPLTGQSDKAALLIHICSFQIFYAILAIETAMFTAYSIIKAIKRNYSIPLGFATALTIIYAFLETSVILNASLEIKALISVILASVFFMLSYSGINQELKDIRHNVKADVPHQSSSDKTTDIHQSMADEDSLRIRFEDMIVSEQLFLKQGIRLADIATMLDTNRTYVSRLVNNTYNMSFSDYINTLRIDYAEQYLLHNRDAKQSDIAAACGFPNASAFNSVFKKVTGVTPKVWLATNS